MHWKLALGHWSSNCGREAICVSEDSTSAEDSSQEIRILMRR